MASQPFVFCFCEFIQEVSRSFSKTVEFVPSSDESDAFDGTKGAKRVHWGTRLMLSLHLLALRLPSRQEESGAGDESRGISIPGGEPFKGTSMWVRT